MGENRQCHYDFFINQQTPSQKSIIKINSWDGVLFYFNPRGSTQILRLYIGALNLNWLRRANSLPLNGVLWSVATAITFKQ